MRSLRIALIAPLALIACGDNGDGPGMADANHADSKMVDAPAATCEYNEANDAGNDDLFGSGAAETTNLNFTTSKLTFCGNIDNTHYDSGSLLVDSDTYKVHVTNGGGARLTLTATGAEALNTVLIEVYDDVSGAGVVGTFVGNHAVGIVDLVPGDYGVFVSGFHTASPASAIAYRATLSPLNLDTVCPHVTSTASFTEASDGVTADGNDVYEVRYQTTPKRKFTDNPLDAPENTTGAFTVAPGMSYRIAGTASSQTVAPADWGDVYQDRDTYAIKTGPNTTEVSFRVNWPSTNADFDLLAFKESAPTEFADAYANSNTEPEIMTVATAPDSTYWMWVGSDDNSTLPATYDLSVCGATFTP